MKNNKNILIGILALVIVICGVVFIANVPKEKEATGKISGDELIRNAKDENVAAKVEQIKIKIGMYIDENESLPDFADVSYRTMQELEVPDLTYLKDYDHIRMTWTTPSGTPMKWCSISYKTLDEVDCE